MMNDQERILSIGLKMHNGEHLSKTELANEFEVSEKTIQRDFSLLRDFVDCQSAVFGEIVYDNKEHTRYFNGKTSFNKKDILVISKILLENRALNKEENENLLQSLLALLSKADRKEIETIIASERCNYAPITDRQNRIEKIWAFSEAIRKERVLDIIYKSPYKENEKQHTIFPVSLYYDAHYFYIVAFNIKYETYMTLRIDRIKEWKISHVKKPAISYSKKFRDGDVRNQHVDAFLGQSITVCIEFSYDPDIVRDQFPDAKILSKSNGKTVLSFTSQNTSGLKRWLLSQGEGLVVLKPESLVEEMKTFIQKMQKNYKK